MQYFLTPGPANRLKELVAQLGLLQTANELMSYCAMMVVYLAAPDERTLLLTAKGVRTRGRVG